MVIISLSLCVETSLFLLLIVKKCQIFLCALLSDASVSLLNLETTSIFNSDDVPITKRLSFVADLSLGFTSFKGATNDSRICCPLDRLRRWDDFL
jgi:hypothetical protein